MARRNPPRKVTYFEPVAPRLARNTIIESTFEVGRRFRCTMRIDCGELDPGAVIRPEPGEWQPRMPASASTKRSLPTGARAVMRSISLPRWRSARASRSRTHEPSIKALLYGGACRRQSAAVRKENPGGGRPGFSRGRARGKNSIVQRMSNSTAR
jgi:hypothetical protein